MRALASIGITPNLVTTAAILGSIAVGLAIASRAAEDPRWLLLLPLWLFFRMALNAIDGMMARQLQMATPLGGVLNEVGDAISDAALYLPLIVVGDVWWPIVLFTLGAIMTEFCGVLTTTIDGRRHYEGPMGKSDRAFFVGALALASAFRPHVQQLWPWLFSIAAILTLITCWNRLRLALRTNRSASGGLPS